MILSIFKRIRLFFRQFHMLASEASQRHNSYKLGEIDRILTNEKYKDPKCLTRFGYKMYSQNREDGIIHEIFNRIGTTSKLFIEFGVGDGLENNTLALLFDQWQGLWIEGRKDQYDKITEGFKKAIEKSALKVVNDYVNTGNIDQIIADNLEGQEIDLLSIDIDGNDIHIFKSIKSIKPRVVIMEYNAKFPSHLNYCIKYNENHIWDGTDHYGASLKCLEVEMSEKGYFLVGCDLTGTNAFFVRKDLVSDKFLAPYTSENHYEPFRSSLGLYESGHRPSYATLSELF